MSEENNESRSVNMNMDLLSKHSNKIIVSRKTVHCNPIAKFDDTILPLIPYDSALKKYVSDELYNRVKLLFDIRPIWSKEVLVEHLENISTYCLKSCFSKICFYFSDGPWRRTYCKYGYDPRKDSSSYIYQTIDFRDNFYRDIKTKSLDQVNRSIIKKRDHLNAFVTNIIKNINNNKDSLMMRHENDDNTKKNKHLQIKKEIHNEDNYKRHYNTYSEYSSERYGMHNNSNKIENYNDFMNTISSSTSNINSVKHKVDIYSNNNSLNDVYLLEKDEEINDILQFLKRSNTFHLRENFSSEIHFSVSPLKLSTIYQYIDIFDNNVLNYLLNVKTQEICTKDNGWLDSKDITKIRDILFVRSIALRRAHSK
ncbi:general transcription factor 3C polypeptide 5, putative [Plasmodium malariae]|uniref:General transcription factor 3C polypeptide 5, putative n=1 Tax=Plasmodium malariae TaxID=5858 RepID=A0A1C3KEM1_PLAMA|nr:general transcription factor 3C polypeptide 5, putative [Plasmodium malariae]